MNKLMTMTTFSLLALGAVTPLAAHPHDGKPGPDFDAPDTFLWLEDVDSERSLDWARAHNKVSEGALEAVPGFAKLETSLLEILDSDAKIPYVSKIGDHLYNFWQDATHVRGIWRRTTLDSFRKAKPDWETVLDLDALGKAEDENWVWHGATCAKPDERRCLVSLSRGGADADVTREFDLVDRAFVKDGFFLPEAKSSASWHDADHLLVGTDFGAGSMTSSGYPRIVKLWHRGTPLTDAKLLFEGKDDDVYVTGIVDDRAGFERRLVYRGKTFYTRDYHLIGDDGKLTKLDLPDHAEANFFGPWLLVELKEDWAVGGKTYPQGALLVTDFDAFMAGKRDFSSLYEPNARRALAGYAATKNAVLVTELDEVRDRLYRWQHGEDGWQRSEVKLPGLGNIDVSPMDADTSDEYFVTYTDFLTPTTLYLHDDKGLTALKELPAYFNTAGLVVSQHQAVSKDGTRVPYFQVARESIATDGSNPTLLYGYGGFEISLSPNYAAASGRAWLADGGVYVIANIRGGGEFGPAWHRAALRENRQRAYDDFIAIAEDLIERGVTRPAKLGIQGGSNGGLLMGAMLTQRPDLFGAVVVQVPLLDMRRYNQLLAGASWMAEYGNPDVPADWAFIRKYSPYQNVFADVDYPAVLFTTSTRDDRVHPGHARKMMAKMEAQGHDDLLYYENIEGGHGGAANNQQRAHMQALAYAFLKRELMLGKSPPDTAAP